MIKQKELNNKIFLLFVLNIIPLILSIVAIVWANSSMNGSWEGIYKSEWNPNAITTIKSVQYGLPSIVAITFGSLGLIIHLCFIKFTVTKSYSWFVIGMIWVFAIIGFSVAIHASTIKPEFRVYMKQIITWDDWWKTHYFKGEMTKKYSFNEMVAIIAKTPNDAVPSAIIFHLKRLGYIV